MSSRRRGKSAGYEPVRETKFPMGLQEGAAVGAGRAAMGGGRERGEDGFAGEIL